MTRHGACKAGMTTPGNNIWITHFVAQAQAGNPKKTFTHINSHEKHRLVKQVYTPNITEADQLKEKAKIEFVSPVERSVDQVRQQIKEETRLKDISGSEQLIPSFVK